MKPPELADVLRAKHIFDAIPEPKGRKPILGREVWFAYCSCGWQSKVPAGTVEAAWYDHNFHRASVVAGWLRRSR